MAIQWLQSLIAGLLVSLIGSLPLGTLNVAAMQIAARESFMNALHFSFGVVAVEMLYLCVTMTIAGSLSIQQSAINTFRIVSVIFLLIMATGSFMTLRRNKESHIVLD